MADRHIRVGPWQVESTANRLSGPDGTRDLEPQVMDLLMLLAARPGEVVLKSDITKALWGEVHVNEDALTRSVFKLRKALGDDARNPAYIDTVSKRGYRLIATVEKVDLVSPIRSAKTARPLWLYLILLAVAIGGAVFAWMLAGSTDSNPRVSDAQATWLARADGFYSQYTRDDNEAAFLLYESILEDQPENAAALAGLSNALTQKLIRYSGPGSDGPGRRSLTEALASGWLDSTDAIATAERAVELAREATRLDPSHDRAWRALGLAHAAAQDFSKAERAYERALVIDPDDWGTMINLSELSKLTDRADQSTPYLEQAWFAMERQFAVDATSIRPWQSAIGLSVAVADAEAGNLLESKLWYRRVLARDPLNPEAILGLAETLRKLGDDREANALCAMLSGTAKDAC